MKQNENIVTVAVDGWRYKLDQYGWAEVSTEWNEREGYSFKQVPDSATRALLDRIVVLERDLENIRARGI